MRRILLLSVCLMLTVTMSFGQSLETRSFTVEGDFDKFYPVVFIDAGWNAGGTELELTRAAVHLNSLWRGSLIARFRFHTTCGGHRSHFCDADIKHGVKPFIADYDDATGHNASYTLIIWLRGGSTTYNYRSVNSNLPEPVVYDGVANSLPFQEVNGVSHSFKTQLNPKLNQAGITMYSPGYFLGAGTNYMEGKLGIGTRNTGNDKLAVNGSIRAKEIVVDGTDWADFVFAEDYNLMDLDEVAKFINKNGHLPDIPKAETVKEKGILVGEINTKLLQKVEELTLYLIEQKAENQKLTDRIQKLEAIVGNEN
ncbi:hypothetical protein EYV94_21490 [Puteibacter caeruleilacunae]|nr:hypothetical protein EYV94_21490 [Puteibacter caeruleilacunae]